MQSLPRLVFALPVCLAFACQGSSNLAPSTALALERPPSRAWVYPQAERQDVVETLHGTPVSDPYRWLEDSDSPATERWIADQQRLTGDYLQQIGGRRELAARLSKLWNYERWTIPEAKGGRLFYRKNDGLENQSVLLVEDSPGGVPRVLLDPNTLSSDGTVALAGTSISNDGRLCAYALADGGSDWNEWRVRDVRSARDLPEVLRWAKFTRPAWTADGQGFFYGRYDAPPSGGELSAALYGQKLYYHRVGTSQEEDQLVYARSDRPTWSFAPQVSDDGAYLFVHVREGTARENQLYLMRLEGLSLPRPGTLEAERMAMVELISDADASYEVVGSQGDELYVLTDQGAPRGRVIELSVARPERSQWRTLIEEGEDTIEDVDFVGGKFFVRVLASASSAVRIYGADGAPAGQVELNGLCSVAGFQGRPEDRVLYFSTTGFATPSEVWRYDLGQARSELVFRPRLSFDPARFETRQVFAPSKDGTRVPVFLTWDRRLARQAKPQGRRALLYGYGGFGVSLTPAFDPLRLVWMEQGGVFAQASLRGGGEFGEAWHSAGKLANKQNVFDDFIGVAEYLVREGYTTPQQLSIKGGSNGGLLVGAALLQRPDLFGAAIPSVGVLDMLRFHKFTIGWAWISDYGSPDDPRMFEVLRRYSPLHNVRTGVAYPATLITTADRDDRVVPAHSFKFAAALQHAQTAPAPILIRIESRAGHGAGKPTTKLIDAAADELAFLLANT